MAAPNKRWHDLRSPSAPVVISSERTKIPRRLRAAMAQISSTYAVLQSRELQNHDLAFAVHIPDHRLAALIHMHMLDADSLRIALPEAP